MSHGQPPEQQPLAYTQYGRSSYQPPASAPAPRSPRQSRIGWIIVGVFSVCVIACCIGTLVLSNVTGSSIFSNVNTGPFQQSSPTATAPLNPTLVLTPHILTGATLGGTQDAFMAAFGVPVMTGPVPHYHFTLADGTPAGVCFCGTVTGLDGQQHLDTMSVGPGPGITWSLATKTAVVKLFLPPDAVYVRTIQDPTVGPILVYLSPDLAQTFPANQFTDSGGGPAPPAGTLSVACQKPGIADCTIETGT